MDTSESHASVKSGHNFSPPLSQSNDATKFLATHFFHFEFDTTTQLKGNFLFLLLPPLVADPANTDVYNGLSAAIE